MTKAKSPEKIKELMLLFGAGASIHCGVPTGVPLVNMIAKDFHRSKEMYEDIRRHFKKQKGDPDFEEFLIYLDLMNQLQIDVLLSMINEIWPKDRKSLPNLKKQSKELRLDLLRGIRNICLDFDLSKASKQYEPLFELSNKTKIFAFTTNYDPIIEEVLNDMGKSYSTNFMESRRGQKTVFYWDSKCDILDKANIQVIKLHGSVYWYKDKKTKEIEEISHPTTRSSKRNPVEHIMITPTVFKDIYQPPYYALYDKFQETLKNSKLLIIVGHSLRDEWLRGAIFEHLDKEGLVVYVGTRRSPDLSDIVKELTKFSGFIYCPIVCEKFIPLLATVLKESNFVLPDFEKNIRKASKDAEDILEKNVSASLSVPNKAFRPNDKVKIKIKFEGSLIKGFYRISLLDSNENPITSKDLLRSSSGIGTLSGYSKSRSRTITVDIPSNIHEITNQIIFRYEVIDQPTPDDEEQIVVIVKDRSRQVKAN